MNIPKLVADVESIAEWLRDRVTCSMCYRLFFRVGGQGQSGVHVGRTGSRIRCYQREGCHGSSAEWELVGKGLEDNLMSSPVPRAKQATRRGARGTGGISVRIEGSLSSTVLSKEGM